MEKLRKLVNPKLILLTPLVYFGLNTCLIAFHNLQINQMSASQCMTNNVPACSDYCTRGVDATIDDEMGKTGQVFLASQICCCSLNQTYSFFSISLSFYYLFPIYIALLVIQLMVNKFKTITS
jgi:hypothetical protein